MVTTSPLSDTGVLSPMAADTNGRPPCRSWRTSSLQRGCTVAKVSSPAAAGAVEVGAAEAGEDGN